MSIITEKALMAALKAGLPTDVDVTWGFLEQDSALTPPHLPVVCVTRVNAALLAGGGLQDMCDEDDNTSNTLLQIDAWDKAYEDARNLNELVNAIVDAQDGWSWQSEADNRDPNLKAWRISSSWIIIGDR